MLVFNCPSCNYFGEADDAMAGEMMDCANCASRFRLPITDLQTSEPAPEKARISIQEPGKGAVVEAWARCPRCGARKTNQVRCEFCAYDFWTATLLQNEQALRRRRKVASDLSKLLLIGMLLLGVPGVIWYFKAEADEEERLCQDTLMIIYNAILQADGRKGVPKTMGRRFLVDLAIQERIALQCPSVNHTISRRPIDYRGPARPWLELLPDDPLAADLQGNHRGASVLLKNGSVRYASTNSGSRSTV